MRAAIQGGEISKHMALENPYSLSLCALETLQLKAQRSDFGARRVTRDVARRPRL